MNVTLVSPFRESFQALNTRSQMSLLKPLPLHLSDLPLDPFRSKFFPFFLNLAHIGNAYVCESFFDVPSLFPVRQGFSTLQPRLQVSIAPVPSRLVLFVNIH